MNLHQPNPQFSQSPKHKKAKWETEWTAAEYEKLAKDRMPVKEFSFSVRPTETL